MNTHARPSQTKSPGSAGQTVYASRRSISGGDSLTTPMSMWVSKARIQDTHCKNPPKQHTQRDQWPTLSKLVAAGVGQSRIKQEQWETHARKPQLMLITIWIHCPMATSAFDRSLSYPKEFTRVGAYDHIVDDGARPAIVKMT